MQSPATKGTLSLHRVATAADDPTTFTDNTLAVNMVGFRYATIQAIPINTDDPPPDPSDWPSVPVGLGNSDGAFDIYVWNPYAKLYVLNSSWDAQGDPGAGAGKAFQINVEMDEMPFIVLLKNAPSSGQGVAFFVSASHAVETA